MASKSTTDSSIPPTDYMKHSDVKIVINEQTKPSRSERRLSAKMKKAAITESSESDSAAAPQMESQTEDGTRQTEKNGNTSPPTPTDSSNKVYLDPQPTSNTIFSKSASFPQRLNSNSAECLSPTSTKPPKITAKKAESNLSNAATTYIQTKANSGSVEKPKRHALLPAGCGPKYDMYTYLPGVKAVPAGTLEWKVPLLQKKNKQVIDDFLNTLFVEQQRKEAERKLRDQERIERERIEGIPEWKRPLVRAREEKKKLEQMTQMEQQQQERQEQQKFSALPPWKQELILRKKEQERLESLPEWQRELIRKKKVVNTKKSFEN